MNLTDMAKKLGYTITKKKQLTESAGGQFYTRTDIVVTEDANPSKPPMIFRDRGSLELWLESKAQLELLTQGAAKPAPNRRA